MSASNPTSPVIVTVELPVVAEEDAVKVKRGCSAPIRRRRYRVRGERRCDSARQARSAERSRGIKSVQSCVIGNRAGSVARLVSTVTDDGAAAIVKSGVEVVPHPGNLKFAMRVFQLKLPVVFMYSVGEPEGAVVHGIDLHGAVVAPAD